MELNLTVSSPWRPYQTSLGYQMRENPMGETREDSLLISFDHEVKLESHGAKVIRDAEAAGIPLA